MHDAALGESLPCGRMGKEGPGWKNLERRRGEERDDGEHAEPRACPPHPASGRLDAHRKDEEEVLQASASRDH